MEASGARHLSVTAHEHIKSTCRPNIVGAVARVDFDRDRHGPRGGQARRDLLYGAILLCDAIDDANHGRRSRL